ncbi:MAG: M15 family metallopeptidase [Humidesulfovibrio sp.]|uniref:M15 family metallopeptidase n=1 Tax=Humidesulfovibrio sp. TaxID=2910988 RepID=UPI002734AB2A|nr:M15 family metallopeptidase [Humidesulfovibrio sp.]MDP2847880.1 M15 family metallopeptidase [Humidesulfovibrio sp.]
MNHLISQRILYALRVRKVKRHWARLLGLTALTLWVFAGSAEALNSAQNAQYLADKDLSAEAALDLAVLRAAYPEVVAGMSRGASGHLELVLADGARLVYDDGKPRTSKEAEESPDIRTMLAQVYPLGPVTEQSAHPPRGFDPGRHRVQAFFLALYGHSEAEVRKSCETVRFDGHGALFSRRHGAAAALSRVESRLAPLTPQHPEWNIILRPFGGTLIWRNIAATSRLSVHSFGAALDLNPDLAYWLTERHPEKIPAQVLAFPREILEAFEAEGFIWGGKWAAFDLMHFEYRPELILKARVLRGDVKLPR